MIPVRPATRALARLALSGLGLAVLAVSGCVLEPNQTRKETVRTLGLADPPAATLRLTGTAGADGPARAACALAGHGDHAALEISLRPATGTGPVVTAHLPEGGGEARFTVLSPAGAASEGTGEGTVEVTGPAGTHSASGTLSGRFAGAGGEGTIEATFERCAFFG